MTTKGSLFSVGTTTISGKTETADRVIWRHRINHPSPKQVVKKGIEIKRKNCSASVELLPIAKPSLSIIMKKACLSHVGLIELARVMKNPLKSLFVKARSGYFLKYLGEENDEFQLTKITAS